MATVNEQIVTGRKFRKLVDEATKLWQRISFWTKALDVEFNDGKTAETKVGAIDGITDSLASTSSRIAASAKALNQVNNNLTSHPQFIYDASGKITGYKTKGGADTVFPFKSYKYLLKNITLSSSNKQITILPDTGNKFELIYVVRGKYVGGQTNSDAANFFWAKDTSKLNSYLGSLMVNINIMQDGYCDSCTIIYGSSSDSNVVLYAIEVPA